MEARGTTRDDWREKIERGITFDLKKKKEDLFFARRANGKSVD